MLAMLTTGASVVWHPASTWIPEKQGSAPEFRITQRVALVSVETDGGKAGLDPSKSVRVGDGPASFLPGKAGKTVNWFCPISAGYDIIAGN